VHKIVNEVNAKGKRDFDDEVEMAYVQMYYSIEYRQI
jgi:hypothetical protein